MILGSVYNHTCVSLPSSHTRVVVSETQGFGYSHTHKKYTKLYSHTLMNIHECCAYNIFEEK